jgi:hypothetical protein
MILTICSCSSDDPCVCPDCEGPEPTIQNIWPNADRTFWTYKVTVHTWGSPEPICDSLYATEEEVPPVPTLDEIEDLLREHPIGYPVETIGAYYGQEFDGDTVSHSGATGQNLRETLYKQDDPALLSGRRSAGNPFLQHLYIARPDLRHALEDAARPALGNIAESVGTGRCPLLTVCASIECPILLHGYVWEKTDEWIGTYGDIDLLLAWKFLEADLTPGHEFTHQLVPGLTDDAFLHCRVLEEASVETEIMTFPRGLECLYMIDYGVAFMPPIGEQSAGYCRTFDYGTVTYVPEVGPVASYERLLVHTGEPVGTGYARRYLSLSGFGVRP